MTLLEERTNECFQTERKKKRRKKKGTGTEISQTKLRNIVSVRGVSGKGKNRKIFEDITDKIFSDLMKI